MKDAPNHIKHLMDQMFAQSESVDNDSPLEILFSHCSEFCYPESPDAVKLQKALRESLQQCAPEQADQIMDLFQLICFHYERISFISGLKAGFRLASELMI